VLRIRILALINDPILTVGMCNSHKYFRNLCCLTFWSIKIPFRAYFHQKNFQKKVGRKESRSGSGSGSFRKSDPDPVPVKNRACGFATLVNRAISSGETNGNRQAYGPPCKLNFMGINYTYLIVNRLKGCSIS
jgi:hypothetical protein